MESQEDTFVLMVRSLLEKGDENVDTSSLSDTLKKEIERVADRFAANSSYLEAIQTYALVGNTEKLVKLGKECLKKAKNEYAFEAFKHSKNMDGLVDVGSAFLGEGKLRNAYVAYKLSGNQEMIQFFETNWKEGVDYYM
jgi:hypothetical protein